MAKAVFAPAKINLTLHVTGQRADGYHLLDSLVVFADVGDHLWFDEGPEMLLEVSGPFAAGVPTDRRNLVWQAAELAGWTGRIRLEKNLPHGGGLGGGSSDAAAVLRTLGGAEHAGLLGADVPVCLNPVAQRMRGIGDQLEALGGVPRLHAVLINPGCHVATPSVFNALNEKNNPPMPNSLPTHDSVSAFLSWLREMRNDLENPAITTAPEIEEVLRRLTVQSGCALARISGSGATCLGLFENSSLAEIVAKALAGAHPEWWVQPCFLN